MKLSMMLSFIVETFSCETIMTKTSTSHLTRFLELAKMALIGGKMHLMKKSD